jgi:hypothetical protein
MGDYKPKNEGIKTSTKSQWTERSGAPIASKYMDKKEIEYFKKVLAKSYSDTPESDIDFTFEKILNENDEDRDDCLLLTYRMNTPTSQGGMRKRIIYRTKVPVPEQIKNHAEEMRYRHFQRKTLGYISSDTSNDVPSNVPSNAPNATFVPKQRPAIKRRLASIN